MCVLAALRVDAVAWQTETCAFFQALLGLVDAWIFQIKPTLTPTLTTASALLIAVGNIPLPLREPQPVPDPIVERRT